jgi:hypothetical protein
MKFLEKNLGNGKKVRGGEWINVVRPRLRSGIEMVCGGRYA